MSTENIETQKLKRALEHIKYLDEVLRWLELNHKNIRAGLASEIVKEAIRKSKEWREQN